jgi:5-azacytidine-induced protein 1
VRRLREKYEAQVRDVERSEQAALGKFNECRQTVADLTSELAACKGLSTQMERELEDVRGVAARLTKERDAVTEIVRKEFAERIEATEQELDALRQQQSDDRAQHRTEIAEMQASKDAELDGLHQRVRTAIAMKEETITMLRQQFEAAAVRADHLEQVRLPTLPSSSPRSRHPPHAPVILPTLPSFR